MSIAADFAGYLAAQGFAGGDTGWGLGAGFLPDQPDRCVVTYQFGGRAPATKADLEYVGLQLVVRGGDREYAESEAKITSTWRALDGLGPLSISGRSYRYVHAQQAPFVREYDQNRRPVWAVNFEVGVSRP